MPQPMASRRRTSADSPQCPADRRRGAEHLSPHTRSARRGAPRSGCAPGRPRRSTAISPSTGPTASAAGPRDFLAAATPGAGKTTFALRLASELLRRRVIDRIVVVAPTEHLKTPVGGCRVPRLDKARPRLLQPSLRPGASLPRGGRDVRAGRGEGIRAPAPRRGRADARHPGRGAPRRRRARAGATRCARRTPAPPAACCCRARRSAATRPRSRSSSTTPTSTASGSRAPTTRTGIAARSRTASCDP